MPPACYSPRPPLWHERSLSKPKRDAMGCFEWVSSRALPVRFDLRVRGWRLRGPDCAEPGCARLVDGIEDGGAMPLSSLRGRTLVVGVGDSDARARLIGLGIADALPIDIGLAELDARARSIVARQFASPPRLAHGRLRLDVMLRDARVGGRRLHLNPREFMLLWRLASAQGVVVGREALLRDVFDLGFDPGTNRLAVHVCRLRKKLALAGLASLLVTGSGDGGGYALVLDEDEPGPAGRNGVDALARLREHGGALEEAAR